MFAAFQALAVTAVIAMTAYGIYFSLAHNAAL